MNPNLTYWVEGNSCCNQRWEDAYKRFESETEEIKKFQKRLNFLGAKNWKRDATVVDLFCGSGRNLACLERMGFKNLHGVDLSPRLLNLYTGKAKLYVGDATRLNFPDDWADIVIVQGGLHHLPLLPNDLAKCLDQIQRVLKPGGILIIVEPWLTPFLVFAHWCCRQRPLRVFSSKLDALAVMVEEEKETYFAWLSIPKIITNELSNRFEKLIEIKRLGKIYFVGTPCKN
jgi:ubiquinone/menaquinone biosynthesis C-methylase UbiE